ncbi:MAG TPA: cytochrome c1 [Burkholderiales bacterium]|nr:cytochrome c1 [Burkholderiales bacterium]
MKTIRILAAFLLVPVLGFASEGEIHLDKAPINLHDRESLQRGARTFVNYCLNCHSANYMRYNRLRDIGLTEQQIRDNLVFPEVKVGELMKIAMDPKESKEWFGATPPDLTVIARSRASHAGTGSDWLYTYLRSFYKDPSRPTGWNNVVYPNVGMPHVLWQLQGEQVLKEAKVPAEGYMRTVHKLELERKGALDPLAYDEVVADLVNYMTYMSEPAQNDRVTIGLYAIIVLSVLIGLAYAMKKSYWKDVH